MDRVRQSFLIEGSVDPTEPLRDEGPFGDHTLPEPYPVFHVTAIWKNDTGNGARHNTTFARLYRDETEWRSTGSFGRDDLLVLAKVADLAHSWICEQRQEEDPAEEKSVELRTRK